MSIDRFNRKIMRALHEARLTEALEYDALDMLDAALPVDGALDACAASQIAAAMLVEIDKTQRPVKIQGPRISRHLTLRTFVEDGSGNLVHFIEEGLEDELEAAYSSIVKTISSRISKHAEVEIEECINMLERSPFDSMAKDVGLYEEYSEYIGARHSIAKEYLEISKRIKSDTGFEDLLNSKTVKRMKAADDALRLAIALLDDPKDKYDFGEKFYDSNLMFSEELNISLKHLKLSELSKMVDDSSGESIAIRVGRYLLHYGKVSGSSSREGGVASKVTKPFKEFVSELDEATSNSLITCFPQALLINQALELGVDELLIHASQYSFRSGRDDELFGGQLKFMVNRKDVLVNIFNVMKRASRVD